MKFPGPTAHISTLPSPTQVQHVGADTEMTAWGFQGIPACHGCTSCAGPRLHTCTKTKCMLAVHCHLWRPFRARAVTPAVPTIELPSPRGSFTLALPPCPRRVQTLHIKIPRLLHDREPLPKLRVKRINALRLLQSNASLLRIPENSLHTAPQPCLHLITQLLECILMSIR